VSSTGKKKRVVEKKEGKNAPEKRRKEKTLRPKGSCISWGGNRERGGRSEGQEIQKAWGEGTNKTAVKPKSQGQRVQPGVKASPFVRTNV